MVNQFIDIINDDLGWFWVAFHEWDDLPVGTYPTLWISPEKHSWIDVFLRKKIIVTESTRRSPCGKQYQEVCKEIENIKMIQSELKCHSLLLNSSPHLTDFIDMTLPKCSIQQVQEALKKMDNQTISPDCQGLKKCEKVRYEITSKDVHSSNKTFLFVQFEDTEVEKHLNYVSYDGFSLIGEIGGYLGLTLGFSGVSIILILGHYLCPNIYIE